MRLQLTCLEAAASPSDPTSRERRQAPEPSQLTRAPTRLPPRRACVLLAFANAWLAATTAVAQEWSAGADLLVYTDTDAVQVVSPQAHVRRTLDDDGGLISARFTVDVVTAASVDVVTHATPSFRETRYELGLSASKAFGAHLPSMSYRYSHEPDYVSHGGQLGWRSRLGTPDSVLSLGYGLTHDLVLRHGTSRNAFSETAFTHDASISFAQTLSDRSLLRFGYGLVVQTGYLEKPYRHVPLFTSESVAAARADGTRLDRSSFDEYRESLRPPEEVPDLRIRHALSVRGLHHLPDVRTTLRLDYRFYFDDWGLLAHTIEPAVRTRIREAWDLTIFARVHRQDSASFWRRVYQIDEVGRVPNLRSVDRDLSAYTTLTAGGRFGWESASVSLYVDLSVAHTRYDSFLYRDRLTALIARVGGRFFR